MDEAKHSMMKGVAKSFREDSYRDDHIFLKQDWLDFLQHITILYNLYLEDAESKKKSKQDELMLFSNYTSHQNDDNAKEIQNYLTVKFGMILFLAIDFLQRLT